VIKFYGWELSFQKIVDKIRADEMHFFKQYALVGIITSFTWASAPFFVAAVSYATFVLIDKNNNLDPSTAFVTLTLFYLIRFPLALLPQTITFVVQGYVSLKRIKSFLLLDETNENDILRGGNIGGGDLAISIKNANMGWSKSGDVALYNLNFDMKRGKLFAVVGGVGSGKSSLLSAVLGEMHKLNYGSKIYVHGSTAYVGQQAWIQNATIRENILFGQDYDPRFYNKIIHACSLLPDFNIMPNGDSTEIGEKGINLSGGQKQRISLARAIYANSDIYILDDPLSAVDAHVGKHIFDNVIGPNGMLKTKTRLFVTNSLSFLPQVDQIIMLDNGSVSEMGAYEELKDKDGGPFAEFIKLFLANNEQSKENNHNESMDDTTSPSSLSSSLRSINKQQSVVMGKSKPPLLAQKPPPPPQAEVPPLKKHGSQGSSIFGSGLISENKGANGGGITSSNHDDHLIEKDEIESGSVSSLIDCFFFFCLL
jgi:ABC-type multidrug transport system fused ATPase/permease subunit